MHVRVLTIVLVVAGLAASSGCIANMGELKSDLGFGPQPPEARALANATAVPVRAPVSFSGGASHDPQGLALAYFWQFGDGAVSDGPEAVHAYTAPGDYTVTLTVTNAKGLGSTSDLNVAVTAADRAPIASLGASGSRLAGQPVAFDAARSTDADGDKLAFEWDFGDGTTSRDAAPSHTYAAPGVFVVKLKATDPSGLSDLATQAIGVGYAAHHVGKFDVQNTGPLSFGVPVPTGSSALDVTASFAGGVNDATLVLKDAKGAEVAHSTGTTPPGSQDAQTRTLHVGPADLAKAAAGAWTLQVVRANGVMFDVSVDVLEACGA